MLNHVQQSSTQESPSIVILGRGSGKWSCLRIGRGDLSGVCFALSEMGVEGAGGGFYRRATLMVVLRGLWSGSDGAGDTRQQVRQGGRGHVAGDDGGSGCAAKGGMGGGSALQRGRGSAHGGGHACGGGTSEGWGQ
jgi:hypothetical protein